MMKCKTVIFCVLSLTLVGGCAVSSQDPAQEIPSKNAGDDTLGKKPYQHAVRVVTPEDSGTAIFVTAPRHVLTTDDLPQYTRVSVEEESVQNNVAQEASDDPIPEPQASTDPQPEAKEPSSQPEETDSVPKKPLLHPDQVPVETPTTEKKQDKPKVVKKAHEKAKKTPEISIEERAWQRYCDNGRGMTDHDEKIIREQNYVIPDVFQDNCNPPK